MKFSEWLPDRDAFENPGLVKAHNVFPGTYYKPVRELISQTDALGSDCIGAYSTKNDSGASLNYAGSQNKLYKLSSGTWSDVSQDGDYATADEHRWKFIRFGDTVIASNRSDDIQQVGIAGGAFADLAGSPPKASHLAVVRDFLVLSNLETGSNQVHWSGLNDITEWTVGTAESDSQVFPEGGPITGMVGGEFGLIFQENQITRMEYQGPPLNFSFDVIEIGLGAITGGSIIRFGVQTFYLSSNGFYMTDGTQSYPIGSEKIDKYFFSMLDENLLYKMTSTIDPINKLVIWSYVSTASPTRNPNRLIIYNWDLKRWSEVSADADADTDTSFDHQLIYTSLSEDYTLVELDEFGALATIQTPLDSRIWMGGTLVLSAFNDNNSSASFTGGVMTGTIKTGEFELNEFQMSLITQIWPEIDGSVDIKIASRDSHQDAQVTTGDIGVNSIGFAPFSKHGRFHDFNFTFTGWSRASGFKIKAEATGEY